MYQRATQSALNSGTKHQPGPERRGYVKTPTLGDMLLQFCIRWTDFADKDPGAVGLSMCAVVLGLLAASGGMLGGVPLFTMIVGFPLPYTIGIIANKYKYKADLPTPDTRKGHASMFAKGGIISGLFLSSFGVIGAMLAQLSDLATMNSIAMAIANAGIVVVNAVAGIAGAGTVAALTSMTTLGSIAAFAGAAGVLMVVLSAVSALVGTMRFSSPAVTHQDNVLPVVQGVYSGGDDKVIMAEHVHSPGKRVVEVDTSIAEGGAGASRGALQEAAELPIVQARAVKDADDDDRSHSP